MISKSWVVKVINSMPEEFSIEGLMDQILLLNKIEIGLEQAKKREIYSSEEAKKMIKERTSS